MKAEIKNKLMIWTLLLLAVMIVTALITILVKQSRSSSASLDTGGIQTSSDASLRFSGCYFRDQLDFNQDQMDRFTAFNPVFRQQVQGIHVEMADIRRRMLQEMSAKNSDTIKLNQLSDSIGFLHAYLKRLTYKYYLDIKKISTPEQQEELEILFSGIFMQDIQMGRYGRGGPPAGRRQGRRINN